MFGLELKELKIHDPKWNESKMSDSSLKKFKILDPNMKELKMFDMKKKVENASGKV